MLSTSLFLEWGKVSSLAFAYALEMLESAFIPCVTERLHLSYNLERQGTAARRVYVYEQVVARRVGTARISRISSRRFGKVR